MNGRPLPSPWWRVERFDVNLDSKDTGTMNLKLSPLSALYFFFLLTVGASCNSSQKQPPVSPAFNNAAPGADSAKVKYTLAMVDNKKDPSCGMPLTAGIGDTVHYNGKVYGFCSDECKQIFLKNADSLSRSAEMK
jgi:YHS domain-containing protein